MSTKVDKERNYANPLRSGEVFWRTNDSDKVRCLTLDNFTCQECPLSLSSIRAAVEARQSRREAREVQRRQESHQQSVPSHMADVVEQVMERGDNLQCVEQRTGRLFEKFTFISSKQRLFL